LRDAGFTQTGEVSVMPGGAVRFVYGTTARVAESKGAS
jgi:hypothetical protein